MLFPLLFIRWHGSGHPNLVINVTKMRKCSTCLPRREREREREREHVGRSVFLQVVNSLDMAIPGCFRPWWEPDEKSSRRFFLLVVIQCCHLKSYHIRYTVLHVAGGLVEEELDGREAR
jgi:hypothetical protein